MRLKPYSWLFFETHQTGILGTLLQFIPLSLKFFSAGCGSCCMQRLQVNYSGRLSEEQELGALARTVSRGGVGS